MAQAYAIAMLVLWVIWIVYFYRKVQPTIPSAVALGFLAAVPTMILGHIAYWLILAAIGLPI